MQLQPQLEIFCVNTHKQNFRTLKIKEDQIVDKPEFFILSILFLTSNGRFRVRTKRVTRKGAQAMMETIEADGNYISGFHEVLDSKSSPGFEADYQHNCMQKYANILNAATGFISSNNHINHPRLAWHIEKRSDEHEHDSNMQSNSMPKRKIRKLQGRLPYRRRSEPMQAL